MNTKPINAPTGCMYERYGEKNLSYVCDRPAVCIWLAPTDPPIEVPVCTSCRNWLLVLQSLGMKQ